MQDLDRRRSRTGRCHGQSLGRYPSHCYPGRRSDQALGRPGRQGAGRLLRSRRNGRDHLLVKHLQRSRGLREPDSWNVASLLRATLSHARPSQRRQQKDLQEPCRHLPLVDGSGYSRYLASPWGTPCSRPQHQDVQLLARSSSCSSSESGLMTLWCHASHQHRPWLQPDRHIPWSYDFLDLPIPLALAGNWWVLRLICQYLHLLGAPRCCRTSHRELGYESPLLLLEACPHQLRWGSWCSLLYRPVRPPSSALENQNERGPQRHSYPVLHVQHFITPIVVFLDWSFGFLLWLCP